MRTRQAQDRRCSYVVLVESTAPDGGGLRDLANYLTTVGLAGCDVVILDASPRPQFESNARVLRWVGRHVAVGPDMRSHSGAVDVIRAAAAVAACEKVIVAAEDVRYTPSALEELCRRLEMHEVAEPQDYLDPLPWWGGIEAGRMLVHRGIEPQPDHGATFGFRRSAIRSMRSLLLTEGGDDPVRRLMAHGAEVHPAADVFVRREPPALADWWAQCPRLAGEDFVLPFKSAFFFALGPMILLLAVLGGLRLAAGYAAVVAFVSMVLAMRGRSGAASFFPLRACFFAPVWVLERSVSVYWALYQKLRGAETGPARLPVPERARGERIASNS